MEQIAKPKKNKWRLLMKKFMVSMFDSLGEIRRKEFSDLNEAYRWGVDYIYDLYHEECYMKIFHWEKEIVKAFLVLTSLGDLITKIGSTGSVSEETGKKRVRELSENLGD